MTEREPLLETMNEAARLLSISRRQLDRMWREGQLATRQIGRRRYVPRSEILRLSLATVGHGETPADRTVAGGVPGSDSTPALEIVGNQQVA